MITALKRKYVGYMIKKSSLCNIVLGCALFFLALNPYLWIVNHHVLAYLQSEIQQLDLISSYIIDILFLIILCVHRNSNAFRLYNYSHHVMVVHYAPYNFELSLYLLANVTIHSSLYKVFYTNFLLCIVCYDCIGNMYLL